LTWSLGAYILASLGAREARVRRSWILLLFAAASAASCSVAPRYSLDESLARLGVEPPAVPGSWKAASPEDARVIVSAALEWGAVPAGPGGLSRVVASEFFAIADDWLSARPSVDPTIVGLEAAAALAEPLAGICLPHAVVAYGSLYPGDPGYPLVRSVVVTARVSGRDPGGRLVDAAQEYLSRFPAQAEPQGLSWLGAVGDVMPGAGTSAMLVEPDGPERVFMRLLPIMRSQDILLANLETAVTERGTEWPKTFRFRMPAAALAPLMESGVDAVSLANNHVYDYTEQGFADTVAALRATGLPFVGAGLDWDEAIAPYETGFGSERLSFWGLGAFPVERTGFYGLEHASVQRGAPGLLWADSRAVRAVGAALEARRDSGRLLVVGVHAGLEYTERPYGVQTGLYRSLVDAGADVVLGHHPHVLQPMEWYEGPERSGLIVYSLGNFVFDNVEDRAEGMETMLLSLGVSSGEVRALRVFPARMKDYRVDLDDGGAIAARFAAMCSAWAASRGGDAKP